MQEFKKRGNLGIIEKLRKERNRKTAMIIILILLAIILVSIFLLWMYFASPEYKLEIGAEIKKVSISEDGKTIYIELKGGSNEKEITKIKFIFTTKKGEECSYETTEGASDISVKFKRSFWDWLFGKPLFVGEFDYQINEKELGCVDSFYEVKKVTLVFEYKTDKGPAETPPLDTGTTIIRNQTASSGGGHDSGDGNGGHGEEAEGSDDYVPVCGDNIKETGEQCDNGITNTDAPDKNCYGKVNYCSTSCSNITINCDRYCGNNIIDIISRFREVCDGNNLSGKTCEDYGYAGGNLSCLLNCGSLNVTGCKGASCTNDYGCLGIGDFCDKNLTYNCSVGGDGCLNRINITNCSLQGKICQEGRCVECIVNSDCNIGERCSAGACIEISAIIEINSCSELDQQNSQYRLTADIFQSLNQNCIDITAKNITLDCQNHYISTSSNSYIAGIFSNQTKTIIKNCNLTGFSNGWGIYLENANDSIVSGNVMTNNFFGFDAFYSSNMEIIDNNINSNSYGFSLETSSTDSLIQGNDFCSNENSGTETDAYCEGDSQIFNDNYCNSGEVCGGSCTSCSSLHSLSFLQQIIKFFKNLF